MIKTLVAHSREIDDLDAFIYSIKEQLHPEKSLCSNSVGILACHAEFVHSGAVKALSEALPFDIVGTVTTSQSTHEACDALMLSLMVLTSDDVSFVAQLSPPFEEDHGKAIEEAYKQATACHNGAPALILTFAPLLVHICGDDYVEALTRLSGNVPCFGSLALDEDETFENSFVLFNGEHSLDCMGMILLYGNVTPRFIIASLSPEKVAAKPVLITKSEKNIIQTVNHRPIHEYFAELGLSGATQTQFAMAALPLMLDYGDGTPPVSRVVVGCTPEKYAVCAGVAPQGASLHLGELDKQDVLLTTGKALDLALENAQGASCMLLYSCVSRAITLGGDPQAELNLVQEKIHGRLPFLIAYSGGEMCPTQTDNGKAINRFHNNTFILCML